MFGSDHCTARGRSVSEDFMTRRLFVGNLSFDVSEAQLQAAFAPYGATGAMIPTRWSRSGRKADRPKGFGFVEVAAQQMEPAIAAMTGHILDGRALEVREAKPRPELYRFDERRYENRGYGGGGGYRGRRS